MNRVGFIVSVPAGRCWRCSAPRCSWSTSASSAWSMRLGQIKDVITEPGLNFKLPPPFQNVSYIDKRLLTLDSTDAEPMLTAEKQRVVIDWYVRWRITEPTEYIRNVGLDEKRRRQPAQPRGAQCLPGRNQQAHRQGAAVAKREALMADVKREVLEAVRGRQALGRRCGRCAHHARRLRRGHHRIGLPPHGGRAQACGQRVALHRCGRRRKDPRRCRPPARGDRRQCLPRCAEDQGRGRCRGGAHLMPKPLAAIRSSPSSTAAWMPTRPASARRAT